MSSMIKHGLKGGKRTMSKMIEAICNSQRLENPGPPVVGIIRGERFTLNGVLQQHGMMTGQTLVCIRAADRSRLKGALPLVQRQQLAQWTKQERRQYSGFYVPITWFETLHIMSREEWLARSLKSLLFIADSQCLVADKRACTCHAMRAGYTCPYCNARAALALGHGVADLPPRYNKYGDRGLYIMDYHKGDNSEDTP